MTHTSPASAAVPPRDSLAPDAAAPAPDGHPADAHTGAQPSADRPALRDRIAEALYRHEWPRKQIWAQALATDREVFEAMAAAVLAVLPDHTAVRAATLNEAADAADRIATAHREGEYGDELTSREVRDVIETVAAELRDLAAAARPDDTTGATP